MAEDNSKSIAIIVAVIAAGGTVIAAVIAAVIGLLGHSDSSQASAPTPVASATTTAPSASPAGPSDTETTTARVDDTAPAVRESKPLTLIDYGPQVDLDVVDDPQWGTTDILSDTGDQVWDIAPGRNLGGVSIGAPSALIETTPTYEACHDATGLSSDDLTFTALRRAKALCVFTTGGRIAVLKVVSANAKQVKFDVTTYDKDGD